MAKDENMHAIRYHNKHEALAAMYALAKESFITDPEIVIASSDNNKSTKMTVLSREGGTLPDEKGWEVYENDEKIEVITLVASTDLEDKRRFTVTFIPEIENVLALNFVAGVGDEEQNVMDFLLSM